MSKKCQFEDVTIIPLYYCITCTRSSLSCLLAFYGIPIFNIFNIVPVFNSQDLLFTCFNSADQYVFVWPSCYGCHMITHLLIHGLSNIQSTSRAVCARSMLPISFSSQEITQSKFLMELCTKTNLMQVTLPPMLALAQ